MRKTLTILLLPGLVAAVAFYLSSPDCLGMAKAKKEKAKESVAAGKTSKTEKSEKPHQAKKEKSASKEAKEGKKAKKGKKKADKEEAKEEAKEEKKEKKEEKKEAKSTEDQAEELHSQAVEYYKTEKYEEALEYFKKADALVPNPVTMFNMGRCYDKLGKFKEAYEYYKKYAESGDSTRLEDAKEAMAKIEQMPIKLKVVTEPRDAEVFVDGKKIEGGSAPYEVSVSAGQHTLFVRKSGYEEAEEELDLPSGADADIEVKLVKSEGAGEGGGEEGGPRLKKTITGPVPITLHIDLGATVSTSKTVTSYMDATLGIAYRIKDWSVGIGLDNMFYTDSYLLAAYATGAYTVKLPKGLSMNFAVGFGGAYLYSSEQVVRTGEIILESGHMWDLVVHADVKLRYKVGPVLLQAIPVSADVFVGVGSIKPAPLAQFAFLLGVACEF